MARESRYVNAEEVKSGDETRLGIVAGVEKSGYEVRIQYHNTEQIHHQFSQVEVFGKEVIEDAR